MSERISVNHTTNIGGGVKIKKRPRINTEEEVVCISSSVDRQLGSTKHIFENGQVDSEGVGVGQYFSSGLNNHNVEESQRKSEARVNPINSDGVRVDGDEGGGGGVSTRIYSRSYKSPRKEEVSPRPFDFFGQQIIMERERLIKSRGTYGPNVLLRAGGYEVMIDREHKKVIRKRRFPKHQVDQKIDQSVKLQFRSDGEFDQDFIRKIKELEGLPVLENGSIPLSVWKVPEPLGFFAAQSKANSKATSTSEAKVDGVSSSDDGAKGSEPLNFDDPMQSGYYAPLQGLVPSSTEAAKMTKAQKREYRRKLAALAESYWSTKPAAHSLNSSSSASTIDSVLDSTSVSPVDSTDVIIVDTFEDSSPVFAPVSTSASTSFSSAEFVKKSSTSELLKSSKSSMTSIKIDTSLKTTTKIDTSIPLLPLVGSTVRKLQNEQERLLEEAAASFAEQLKNDRLRREAINNSTSVNSNPISSCDGWIDEQQLTREVAIATASQTANPRSVLGLGSKTVLDSVMLRKRYYFLAKLLHPDKFRAEKDAEGSSGNASDIVIEKAIGAFKAVSLAYETLSKETR